MSDSLRIFLENKPLYYKEIDTARIHKAYDTLRPLITLPRVVHIVGTNGKGSTGRIIAHLAYKQGLSVGHYTSPHIFDFNERIWLDGVLVDYSVLDKAHKRLFGILGKEQSDTLSYFEYATLLALIVFENCDLIVLEAGLGGVDDATNVVLKSLSVITPIGLDHQVFLGESIEQIARAKLESIEKDLVLAPQPFAEVTSLAHQIVKRKNGVLYKPDNLLFELLKAKVASKNWADFLIQNALVALKALEVLGIPYNLDDLESLELFGRFYPILPNVRIDVGHNLLAAQAIEKALLSPIVLIYNSLDDKPFEEILSTLKPKIKKILFIPIQTPRAIDMEILVKAVERLGIEYGDFDGLLLPDESYVVFGSFYTVEAFLSQMRLHEK